MSISPPSDIVLGVASAVDPEKYRVAAERLARLGSGGDTTTGADAAASTTKEAWAAEQFTLPQTPAGLRPAIVGAAAAFNTPASTADKSATALPEREVKAYKQLEAYLMQTFIDSMLPKEASNVYGSGTAGNIWRSMFAEHISAEVSAAAPLGIAENIARSKVRMKSSADSGAATQPKSFSGGAAITPSVAIPPALPLSLKTGAGTTIVPASGGSLDRRGS